MQKFIYIGIAIAMLGCTKSEEIPIPSATTDEGVISFSAGEIAARVTDSGSTLSWEEGEQIYITSADGIKGATYQVTNTTTGALAFIKGDDFYTNANQSQTFYGWAPSTLTATEGKLSLDLSDQSAVSQAVVGSATTDNTTATLAFEPIYTKVIFNLTVGYIDVIDLTGATVTLTGANVKGDYDYAAGVFSNLTSEEITPTLVVSDEGFTATVTAYILETAAMSGKLTITVGSDIFETTLSGKSWIKGDMYEYNITVGAQ